MLDKLQSRKTNFDFFDGKINDKLKHTSSMSVFVSENDTNIFFHLSKVWSILHHGSVGRVHKKVT